MARKVQKAKQLRGTQTSPERAVEALQKLLENLSLQLYSFWDGLEDNFRVLHSSVDLLRWRYALQA